MITYEEALAKAKSLKPNIDNCGEYEKGYIFGSHEDDESFGGDGPVVILKETGEAVNILEFEDSGKLIHEFDI